MGLPFEQQPGESEKAFAAFAMYLSMGAERSTAAVARKLAKSDQLIRRWSARWRWGERVKAHGAHLAKVEREATEALARGVSAEWLRRQEALRETEWQMHEECIAAARRGLKAFMEREKVYANLADIARMLEVASKLGRLASGMATDKTELTGEDGGPIRVELSAALEKVYGAVVDVEAVVGGEGSQEAEIRRQEGEKGDTSPLPSPQGGEGEGRQKAEGRRQEGEKGGTSPRPSPQSGEGEGPALLAAAEGEGGNTSPRPSPQSGEGEEGGDTSPLPSPQGGAGKGGSIVRRSDSRRSKGECEGSAL